MRVSHCKRLTKMDPNVNAMIDVIQSLVNTNMALTEKINELISTNKIMHTKFRYLEIQIRKLNGEDPYDSDDTLTCEGAANLLDFAEYEFSEEDMYWFNIIMIQSLWRGRRVRRHMRCALYQGVKNYRAYKQKGHPAQGKRIFFMPMNSNMEAARKLCPTCVFCASDIQAMSKKKYYECRCIAFT
jgi:hypothetical protein